MENRSPEHAVAMLLANACISCIAECLTEAEVQETVAQVVRYFDFQAYVFTVMVKTHSHEHFRYLLGCDPQLCYRYFRNKWYAIDPSLNYALRNTSPVLFSELSSSSPGQQRLRADSGANGFRNGVAIPAHGNSSSLVGVLYLGTEGGSDQARHSLDRHRNLMRALALELLEWWNTRLRTVSMAELDLDTLDVALLCQAREQATTEEAAAELGITPFCAKKRYERMNQKLQAPGKRHAVEKAIMLGLIQPAS